ncbi:MAG: ABC transporter substrate-binding protein [Alphaproteobacteria bacterium]|nr:ABC transporter substrate-binding protein [Alphaproteobacteria bacterium]
MRERIIAGVLALGLASAVMAEPAMAQEKASVGYYPGALISMPVLVASEKKFFEKNGLAVELVPVASGPAMTSAVASGSVTFVNNSWDNLILAVDKGLPVRAVAGSTVKVPFALLVRSGIALPHQAEGYPGVVKDLVGKNWGVLALGVSVHFMAQTILTDAGYKVSDVTFLAVGLPNTARPALQRGTVDTYLSIEPLLSIAAASKEAVVVVDLSKNQGPKVFHDLGYNGWWASTSTIKDKPEVVARFGKALEESYCWFSKPENLDEVVGLMKKYVKVPDLPDEAFKTMVKGLLPTFGPEITPRTIDTWAQLLVDNKQLAAAKTRKDVVADSARESFRCP